jgi:hypothetical protein
MLSRLKKAALASALAATALTSVTPAMAQGYPGDYGGYRHRDRGDSTGAAIIGGVIGIAIGALIASGGNKKNKHKRHRADLEYRDGSYYDREGRRCDRDGRPYDEDQGYYQRRGYNGGYADRGYGDRYSNDQGDRGYYRGN